MTQPTLFNPGTSGSALLGGDNNEYRYTLGRTWGDGPRRCNFIMLNPSTEDEVKSDPTIRRCIAFAKAWGYDELIVTNLFAIRSTDPSVLKTHEHPVGPLNDELLIGVAKAASIVVCAWGVWGALHDRGRDVLAMLRVEGIAPHCLVRVGKDGHPGHPLYLPKTLVPVVMT